MHKNKNAFPIKRIALDAILIAFFSVLSMFSVTIAGVKITFASLPGVLAAMLFGPCDAFIVGFGGAFLEQMLKFGFTPTTLLWILPPAVQPMIIGFAAVWFKKYMSLDYILGNRKPLVYFASCMIAGLVTSLLNTAVYYVDSHIYGYYTFALIFGVLGVRILTNQLVVILTGLVAMPVLGALHHSKLVPQKQEIAQ